MHLYLDPDSVLWETISPIYLLLIWEVIFVRLWGFSGQVLRSVTTDQVWILLDKVDHPDLIKREHNCWEEEISCFTL